MRRALLAHHRAMLSQHVNVTFPFTVEEIVHMGAGDTGRAAAQRLVDAALGEVGLERISATGNCRRSPAASSNARILPACWCSSPAAKQQHGPGLLLLDEPTSSLDMRHQIDLVETAQAAARRTAPP